MNPLIQGWSASHIGSHAPPTWGTQPSLYGALPYHTSRISLPADSFVAFTFSSLGTTILNSVLVGSDGQMHFYITTDGSTQKTVVEDANRGCVGLISWGPQPTIVIDDLAWTMRTSQWLYLSSNRECRTMIVGGEKFSWRPNGGFIELFPLDKSDSQPLARISQAPSGTILQLTLKAIQKRLLKAVVISAVLLMSGRRID
ncbi:hypothetical protein B0H13DRAFT_1623005 [Mycena leptocephala]|nr:hypothetical protein B0H13DRAFT_1623005 [Mycena leptocephala]